MTDTQTTVLNVRGLPADAAVRIKRAARSRNMTIGEYLDSLSKLHDKMRELADSGEDDVVKAELEALGLQTVRT
jgi:hypothetical protein